MIRFFCVMAGVFLMLSTAYAQHDPEEGVLEEKASSAMNLRDAIYLYDKQIYSTARKWLIGYNCDIFEIVLDVQRGYTDILISEYTPGSGSSDLFYPDRIYNTAAMFAYSLYSTQPFKGFLLGSNMNGANTAIGTATFFGYCFSNKSDAMTMMYDEGNNTCLLSSGETRTNCLQSGILPQSGIAQPSTGISQKSRAAVQNMDQN